ncbi:MAG: hypothetical protein JRI45_03650 [Deltaproteobacteria bacterium]|nr:hypothetical protein [Deltaproteobacteria bacterium]MBW2068918.1 hypothetical protein [Deltaproteobacteria bacterium]
MFIEKYSFGSMVIAGKRYDTDLKIIEGKVYPNWWRRESHFLCYEDVVDVVKSAPEVLVVGTGANGLMRIDPQLKDLLSEKGIELRFDKTGKAVEIFNDLYRKGQSVAGVFHLTC